METTSPAPSSVKKAIWIALPVLLLVVGAAWGWTALRKTNSTKLPTPEEAKEIVTDYLETKSGKSHFSSPIEVTKDVKGDVIWQQMKTHYDAPPNYETLYGEIGNDLTVVDKLFASDDEKQWGRAIRILFQLCEVAHDDAVDPWLSARICDAYLVPNLDKIEDKPKHGPDREQVMQYVARVYRNAEESDRLIELGKFYLTKFSDSKRADVVRWHLARALEQKGKKDEAVTYLRQITHPSLTNEAAAKLKVLAKAPAKK